MVFTSTHMPSLELLMMATSVFFNVPYLEKWMSLYFHIPTESKCASFPEKNNKIVFNFFLHD